MARDLVVGIDSSTQSTKAIAFDARGRVHGEGRAPVPLATPAPGFREQDPEDWWTSLAAALRGLLAEIDPARVAALAITNQRETIAFLDEDRRPVRSAIVWLDERGRACLDAIAGAIGAEAIHRITGKPHDQTPALCKIAWVREREPEAFARTAFFADVQATLVGRLTGRVATSWASADPLGLYDIAAKRWSADVLAFLGIGEASLPPAARPGSRLGAVSAAAAEATGLAPGTPVIAAGGDGQCAGLGTGCTAPGRAYVNLGTALVSGVWSAPPALSPEWRTLLSVTGDGYILETVQRTGTFLVDWFARSIAGIGGDAAAHAALDAEAAAIAVGSEGLLALPYWSGCMNPHWDPDVRGAFVGLTGSHRAAHMHRAILEGLTLVAARGARATIEAGVPIDEFVVIGGGAKSRLWVEMLADATGRPVRISDTVEASALGAAMAAAAGAGWFGTVAEAAGEMTGELRTVSPNDAATVRYAALMSLHDRLYGATADLCRELVAWRTPA
jgi:xylulokinase